MLEKKSWQKEEECVVHFVVSLRIRFFYEHTKSSWRPKKMKVYMYAQSFKALYIHTVTA